jgi:hypothetical protein
LLFSDDSKGTKRTTALLVTVQVTSILKFDKDVDWDARRKRKQSWIKEEIMWW